MQVVNGNLILNKDDQAKLQTLLTDRLAAYNQIFSCGLDDDDQVREALFDNGNCDIADAFDAELRKALK